MERDLRAQLLAILTIARDIFAIQRCTIFAVKSAS
jgi:hypothetical protein